MNKIPAARLSQLAMVAGQESRTPTVINSGIARQWVGFGWIDLRAATDEDRALFPEVDRSDAEAKS